MKGKISQATRTEAKTRTGVVAEIRFLRGEEAFRVCETRWPHKQ
jgi:hypothetical protein